MDIDRDNRTEGWSPWMDTEQAAAYLGKSVAWLRNNAKQFGIPRVRLGQQWRYKATEIDRWLESGLGAH